MRDRFGREIDYLRISITDRCNLRCQYCMPHGILPASREEILRYEEILRVCTQAVALGIVHYKITGGEPLTRKGCAEFLRDLKALPGVLRVTLTTNGLLLPALLEAPVCLDGINVSVDTLNPERYAALTGFSGNAAGLLQTLTACLERGIPTKVNVVLLEETRDDWLELAALAEWGVDVRFIELMPVGAGAALRGARSDEALDVLRRRWPDLHPVDERRGAGPARYFASGGLMGRIGLIDAVSHSFCRSCNRIRLTSTGFLKPCLCYDTGTDLRVLLRGGASDELLRNVIKETIYEKPLAHCFKTPDRISEHRAMSQIGG